MQTMTVVSATVPRDAEADLLNGYRQLTAQLPPMILQTFLLRGDDGEWQIATHWRSSQELAEYRQSVDTPPAVKLFRDVGAQPRVTLFQVAHHETG